MAGTPFLTVTVDWGPLNDLLARLTGGAEMNLQQLIQESADSLTGQLRATAPVRKNPGAGVLGGTLRDSLVFDVGQLGATLLGVEYAQYVIQGTVPHPIDAKNAPELVFFWEKIGAVFHGPHVNHPGTRPNDFRFRALENAVNMGELELVAARFFQRMVGGGNG
ncbi:MAG: hypothetical protein ACYCOR_10850 [Acidobacteriaceae bacterium]